MIKTRPKKPRQDKQNQKVTLYLTVTEWKNLDEMSHKRNRTKTELIRNRIRDLLS
jgi:hypothetical protein